MGDRARGQFYSEIWKIKEYFNLVRHTSGHYHSRTLQAEIMQDHGGPG